MRNPRVCVRWNTRPSQVALSPFLRTRERAIYLRWAFDGRVGIKKRLSAENAPAVMALLQAQLLDRARRLPASLLAERIGRDGVERSARAPRLCFAGAADRRAAAGDDKGFSPRGSDYDMP